jgi:hypothetical protein
MFRNVSRKVVANTSMYYQLALCPGPLENFGLSLSKMALASP